MEYQKIMNLLDNASMLKSSSYDYSDAYIFVKGTITVNNTGTDAVPNKRNKKGNIRKLHTIY